MHCLHTLHQHLVRRKHLGHDRSHDDEENEQNHSAQYSEILPIKTTFADRLYVNLSPRRSLAWVVRARAMVYDAKALSRLGPGL